jgi:two-component system, NtrC family, sensor kinase
MIKTATITFLLLLTTSSVLAQSKTADSLRAALQNTTKPAERFDILNRLQLELSTNLQADVDSAGSVEMFKIAQQLNNDSMLAISYNWLGFYFSTARADYLTGLEYLYKAIPYAEKVKDKRRISSLYFDIALIFMQLKDYEEASRNTKKAFANLPDKNYPRYDFMLIQYEYQTAFHFLMTNQPDSALYHVKRMDEINLRIHTRTFESMGLRYKAVAYSLLGKNEQAEEYFKRLSAMNDSLSTALNKLFFYNTYIPFLLKEHRIEEAAQQAKKCLRIGTETNNLYMRLAGAGYLRKVFEEKQQIDSAYYFSQMEAAISTEVAARNNANKINSLAFNEQIRRIEEERRDAAYRSQLKQYALIAGIVVILVIAAILYRNNTQKQKANKLLLLQKKEIEQTLLQLKSAQAQLVQSEKMASLGELTAGIAHEIQNPLNFVNNFSEVSTELLTEMNEEIEKGNYNDVKAIAKDVIDNQEKINHHGKRADAIVKGMLQHSRSSTGIKEPTDINALTDEYFRLAYHGLRAKDKNFNVAIKTDFDKSIGNINIIPQDIGRVLLNLINNAFYAVTEKNASTSSAGQQYEPTVSVSTKKINGKVEIKVKDNGNGIPQKILDKIFQPFFTTKPTGQGTGLGLSLSYDIIKAHGGEIRVETNENEGAEFFIKLPLKEKE